MHVASAGVVPSPGVEVGQSGYGALKVVLLDMDIVPATSDYQAVWKLYCTRITGNGIIYRVSHMLDS